MKQMYLNSLVICGLGMMMFASIGSAEEPRKAQSGPTWADRRPIARVFLSRSNWRTPKNPGGHLGPKYDLTTEEGRAEFSKGLDQFADQVIATLKNANGQGIVVWDVEGQEWPGMVYVGDPRVLPEYAPQIDKLIDPFFKKIRDAGYRTGLCLRPNHIFRVPLSHLKKYKRDLHNTWGYMLYKEPGLPIKRPDIAWFAETQKKAIAKPEEELAKRADYAHQRWGCTLFYVDTNSYTANVNGKPVNRMMTAEQFARLTKLAPYALIMPEHETAEYYATTSPYNQLDMTGMTKPELRKKYPGCFSVNSVQHERFLAYKWDQIIEGLLGGDALYVDTTGSPNDLGVRGVIRAYRAAALRKETLEPAAVSLEAKSPAGRLAALRAMDGKTAKADVPKLIEIAGNDPEWIVRRATLPLLAAANDEKADAFLVKLILDDQSDLALHAAVAVGYQHPKAAMLLEKILADKRDENRFARNRAVSGLRVCLQPGVEMQLIGVLGDKYSANRGWALQCLKARRGHLAKAGPEVLAGLLAVREDSQSLIPPGEIDRVIALLPKSLRKDVPPSGRGTFAAWDRWVRAGGKGAAPKELAALNVEGLEKFALHEAMLAGKKLTAPLHKPAEDPIPLLWETAQEKDPARRYQAVAALEAAGDQRSVEPLSAMLKQESDAVIALRMLRAMWMLNRQGQLSREAIGNAEKSKIEFLSAMASLMK